MTADDEDMLRRVAEVEGQPGALGCVALDGLLAIGFVEFGFTPSPTGAAPSYSDAWAKLTDAGRVWLAENT